MVWRLTPQQFLISSSPPTMNHYRQNLQMGLDLLDEEKKGQDLTS